MSVEFGINFMPTAPAREVVEWARAVERHGYAILGISDSQSICRDVYVTLGLCAAEGAREAARDPDTVEMWWWPDANIAATRREAIEEIKMSLAAAGKDRKSTRLNSSHRL